MSLFKGTKEVVAVYKGSTSIAAIYKGTKLIFSAFTWENYLYLNLFNGLIPETVNSKSVKNKARISEIYGNSVVVNQLVKIKLNDGTGVISDVSITDYRNGTYKLNGTASALIQFYINLSSNQPISLISGHKYLLKMSPAFKGSDSTYDIRLADKYYKDNIFTAGSSASVSLMMVIRSGYTIDLTITPQLFDLTQMFGTGNEPTSLSDTRVQALLNSEYIPYNAGEIKSVDIGEFSSEPYNLFDGELEGGAINTATGQNQTLNDNFRTKNYTKVIGGREYSIEYNRSSIANTTLYLFEYDAEYNFLKTTTSYNKTINNFTLSNNTCYVRLHWYKSGTNWRTNVPTDANVCIHITGTRTGYAPYKQPQTLSFIYQGNGVNTAQDTMEITTTEYVFTKKIGVVDLGTLTYSYSSQTNSFWSNNIDSQTPNVSVDTKPNLLSYKYQTESINDFMSDINKNGISFSLNGYTSGGNTLTPHLRIRDTAYTDPTTFKSAMAGVPLLYELATPQVIRIPRKHLGIVDLGSLNWSSGAGGISVGEWYSNVSFNIPHAQGYKANIACSKYNTFNSYILNNGTWTASNMTIMISVSTNRIAIMDKSGYANTTDFKNSLSGIYLFYETEEEVEDIDTQIQVEPGGTITSDSVVLPDVMFEFKCH